ncbi:MAG: DoxX family protein, partial [Mesorhizobium sp.]
TNLSGTIDYFTGLGLPLPTLAAWGTGLFELIAGLLILVGFQTRIAALLLAAFTIVAGFIGHFGQGGEDAT